MEPGFYPSGCGGHKNSENAATFSEFLGREEKPRLRAETTGGKTSPALSPTGQTRYRGQVFSEGELKGNLRAVSTLREINQHHIAGLKGSATAGF